MIIRMRKQIYVIQYPSAEREVIVCKCLIKRGVTMSLSNIQRREVTMF